MSGRWHRRLRRGLRARHGVALILTVSMVTLLTAVSLEFAYESRVELALAANARDSMRAEFLARSAVEFSRVLIHVQKTVIDRFKKQLPFPIQIWQMVPIDSELAKALTSGALGGEGLFEDEMEGFSLEGTRGFGNFDGHFYAEIVDEDRKINVNMAQYKTQGAQFRELMLQLIGPVKYNFYFENPDRDGNYTDREELIGSIIDWIDPDEERSGLSAGPEDDRYATLDDPYESKNAPLDTLHELHLVRGVNDEFIHLFGERLSIWGKSINLLTADAPTIAALIRFSLPDDDPLHSPGADLHVLELAYEFVALRNDELLVNSIKDFANYLKADGLNVNESKLSRVAGVDSSVFMIKAVGEVGQAVTRITAVVDASQVPGGKVVYWRVD